MDKTAIVGGIVANFNGVPFYTAKETGAVYVPLPIEAQRSCGRCDCEVCKGGEGMWDTLVIPGNNDKQKTTFQVHFPDLQKGRVPKWLTRGRVDYVF